MLAKKNLDILIIFLISIIIPYFWYAGNLILTPENHLFIDYSRVLKEPFVWKDMSNYGRVFTPNYNIMYTPIALVSELLNIINFNYGQIQKLFLSIFFFLTLFFSFRYLYFKTNDTKMFLIFHFDCFVKTNLLIMAH